MNVLESNMIAISNRGVYNYEMSGCREDIREIV